MQWMVVSHWTFGRDLERWLPDRLTNKARASYKFVQSTYKAISPYYAIICYRKGYGQFLPDKAWCSHLICWPIRLEQAVSSTRHFSSTSHIRTWIFQGLKQMRFPSNDHRDYFAKEWTNVMEAKTFVARHFNFMTWSSSRKRMARQT